MQRKICPVCKQHPVSLNYYRNGKAYYRTTCISCIHRGKKVKPEAPNWYRSGYRKSENCDRCGFKFKFLNQSNVFYTDSNTTNVNWANLKTVCLNCQVEITKTGWRPGPIIPDF
jgi:hypothetical protein